MCELEKLLRDYLADAITLDTLYRGRFMVASDDHLLIAVESALCRYDFDGVPDEIKIRDERQLRYELIDALVRHHAEAFSKRTDSGTFQNVSYVYEQTQFAAPAYCGKEPS